MLRGTLIALALSTSACGGDAKPVGGTPAASGRRVDPQASRATQATDLTFTAGGRSIPGTLVAPTEPGPWPAVLLLAGSGPTDRDWNNPLIQTKNGSGKLLAEALAAHGVVVLRFDKAGTGGNEMPPLDRFTIDTYRDEARSALSLLRARADVRGDRVFVAGHSEGGLHATRLALVAGDELAGVLYLSSAARSMADTMVTQIESQLKNPAAGLTPEQADAELASLKKGLADFGAGRPVDPTQVSTLPPIQQLVAGIVAPATATLTRALIMFDNAAEAPKVALPMLVLGGGKDIQVDPELDARYLEGALRAAGKDVTLHIAPDADHVLKTEPKPVAELRANLLAVQHGYNAEGRPLDPDVVTAIVAWLAART